MNHRLNIVQGGLVILGELGKEKRLLKQLPFKRGIYFKAISEQQLQNAPFSFAMPVHLINYNSKY
jgi:hypothetical protein